MSKIKSFISFAVTNDLAQDQRMQRICNSLVLHGYPCELIGRQKRRSSPLHHFDFHTKRIKCWSAKGMMFYLEYNIRLLLYLFKIKPNIVCAVDLDTIIACRTYSWLSRSSFVFDAHEYFEELPELTQRKLKKWLWKVVRRVFLRKSRFNYTVNQSIAKVLNAVYHLDFDVIHNYPVKHDFQNNSIDLNDPIKLLYQGVINIGRGLEQMIEVIALNPNWELTIIGTGDIESRLKGVVVDKNLTNRVKFLGFIHPDQLSKETAKYDIGLNLLSADSKNYFYSSANKAYDYIMAGLPAIHMNFPEYQKLNNEIQCSLLLNQLAVNDIREAINKLVLDPVFYHKIRNNCLVLKERFNWAQEEQRLITFYDQVAAL